MAVDVTATLHEALKQLEAEKTRIEDQISAIQTALNGVGGRRRTTRPAARPRRRRRMPRAARRAASQRMKAYWANRRGTTDAKAAGATPKGGRATKEGRTAKKEK